MNRTVCRLFLVLASALGLFWATSANALLFRAYLSLNGNDANPCTLQQPCRLLPAALTAVQDGGEIWMLDSANFNTSQVNITKSVKIFSLPGALGSVVANGAGTDAIVINTTGDVTLRNLQVLNLTGGTSGVHILNAGAVHMEKTSIDGFSGTNASSCIRFEVTNPVRLFVDDSFLRNCRNGLYATGTAVLPTQALVSFDNTRIERGAGPTTPTGIWVQGCVAITLRNSVMSWGNTALPAEGIRIESVPAGCFAALDLVNSQILEADTSIFFTNATPNAIAGILLSGSHLDGGGINLSNTAAGTNVHLTLADSRIVGADTAITLTNSSTDTTNSAVVAELNRSQLLLSSIGIDAKAQNGSRVHVLARDTEISNVSSIAVKTSGNSGLTVDLIRSSIHNVTTAVEHHNGRVRLDGNHVATCANDFVNAGSGNMVSLGNNMVECVNGSGLTYITPASLTPK